MILKIFALIGSIIILGSIPSFSQKAATLDELKSKIDSVDKSIGSLLNDITGLKKLKISGFVQFQFEKTESGKGLDLGSGKYAIDPYDSTDKIQNRIRVRRNFVKIAYKSGLTQFVFQGDLTNEKFELKDAYLTITDPWLKYFSLQAGVFNRPNYEVENSSSILSSIERSKVIRTLYPGERDLGAMLTVNPKKLFNLQIAAFSNTYLGHLKYFWPNNSDAPFYYMARITKEFSIQDIGLGFNIGAHVRYGNIIANTNKVIESENNNTVIDSVNTAKGDNIPRTWFGVEAQIYYDFLGGMKILGEFLMGSNADELSTTGTKPIRKRDFSGYYVMLVKNITEDWQVVVKYDSYNPNTQIAETDINSDKDLLLSTLGLGFHNYSFENIRISLWYDMNSTKTKDKVVTSDPIDNFLTFRIQYKF